jgi:hypothetical protein
MWICPSRKRVYDTTVLVPVLRVCYDDFESYNKGTESFVVMGTLHFDIPPPFLFLKTAHSITGPNVRHGAAQR